MHYRKDSFRLKRITFSGILWMVSFALFGQLQVANWYFGNKAGLNFNVPNGNLPQVMFDGALRTIEGCATISDPQGNLLFYTDGIKVYNSQHQLMNATQNLHGDPSSTQSGIIVPNPSNNGIYYIFTVDANDDYPGQDTDGSLLKGFRYSTVNMSLNGGLGAVTSYNNLLPLEPLSGSGYVCSEKVTAVRHANQSDIWVITHLRNKFYAFLVTASGVSTTPVVTTIEPFINPDAFVANSRGYMKASPNGAYLAIAHYSNLSSALSDNNSPAANAANGLIGLYNFNNASGTVSNFTNLMNNGTPYGIEFSPNSKFLYGEVDYFQDNNTSSPTWVGGKIIQWKLEDLSSIDIVNIDQSTPNLNSTWASVGGSISGSYVFRMRGALQLGIDGRIYYSKTRIRQGNSSNNQNYYRGSHISYINNPNLEGTDCDLQINALQIYDGNGADPATDYSATNHYVAYGLPPFITSFFNNEVNIETENICEGEEASFTLVIDPSVENITQIEWDMGDGTQYSNVDSVTHIYQSPGVYTVHVDLYIGGTTLVIPVEEQITVYPKPQVQNASLTQCDGLQMDGKAEFELSLANDDIIVNPNPNWVIEYFETIEEAESGEGTALPNPYTNVTNPQTVYARVTTENGCYRIAELELSVVDELFNLNDYEICDDESNNGIETFDLSSLETQIATFATGDISFFNSIEDAEQNQNSIQNISNYQNTANPQTIYIRVFNGDNCAAIGQVNLVVNPTPIIDANFTDVESCADVSVILNPGEFDSYLWSTGATSPTIEVNTSGVYSVTVGNEEGCTNSASVTVTIHPLPIVQDFEYVQCEDQQIDGIANFNLSLLEEEIVVNAQTTNYTIEYYLDLNSAQNQQGQLPNNYTNTTNNQIIVARVENDNNCVAYAEVELSVVLQQLEPELLALCDDMSNDETEIFDLSNLANELLLENGGTEVYFYLNEQDAINNVAALQNIQSFSNTQNPQTLYIRVADGVNCQALGAVQLEVLIAPVPLVEDATVCPGDSYTFDAGAGFTSYLWSDGSTNQTFTATEEGSYTVTVAHQVGDTFCSSTANFELVYDQPTIVNVNVNGNNIEIIATGNNPPFEYSIDGENWQSSNIFTELVFGLYYAYVRDANGCIDQKVFSVLEIPNIITPNGDGINDQWNLRGLIAFPGSVVEIYDRYGKKLHSHTVIDMLSGDGISILDIINNNIPYYVWDGKYLGRAVPSTSYWYIIRLSDGRVLKGYLVVKNRNSDN